MTCHECVAGVRDNKMKVGIAAVVIISAVVILPTLILSTYQPPLEILLGSYLTELPEGQQGPQSRIFKSTNIKGAVPTNKWWSSVAWIQYSESMYAFPLCAQATHEGLSIGYPDVIVTDSLKTIEGMCHKDLTITITGPNSFPNTTLDGYSDWSVSMLWSNPLSTIRTTLIHGSPFVFATFGNANAQLNCRAVPEIWYGNVDSDVFGLKINGHYYGIFSQAGTRWSLDNKTLTCNKGKPITVALLPTDSPTSAIETFAKYAFNVVTDTKVSWKYNEDDSIVHTDFAVSTAPHNKETIFALFPHQWKNLAPNSDLLSFQYTTIRGTMKTIAGRSFATCHTYNGILPELPNIWKNHTQELDTLKSYVTEVLGESSHYSKNGQRDTYWSGKAFQRICLLVSISKHVGDSYAADHFLNWLKTELTRYFVAYDESGNKKKNDVFYYDSNWGALIGYPAGFGSHTQLNDHHFHYGYWIRAAAEIALNDPAWGMKWGSFVNILIRDIANWNKDDKMFPYLRNFDTYEGHSWASGEAKFWHGNNQESSSEALNAWSALILWGSATNNKTIRDLGIYMYTTEVSAVEQYWFNVDRDNFHPKFKRNYIALVWGGKLDYATWFSGNVEHIRGINLLPISPASLYLGNRPEYVKYNLGQMAQEIGSNDWASWQDIFWEYQSLTDADGALSLYKKQPYYTPEEGESKAHTFSMLHTMKQLGSVFRNVTANTPLYAVFKGDLGLKYVAYNPTTVDITVKFSDGQKLLVPPKQLMSLHAMHK